MIVNIDNVYVASVDDVTPEILKELEISYTCVIGKGLLKCAQEFKSTFFFPLEDVMSEENKVFANNIALAMSYRVDKYYDKTRPKVMFLCGAGLSRSPYAASIYMYCMNLTKNKTEGYWKLKEKNKAIKSVFVE